MAETLELKRIAENTKIQSNVKYHAEFEKAKGKFTQVADDPETLRIKQNSKIISNVAYHGELQKKAIMEQKRTMTGENGEQIGESRTLSTGSRSKHTRSYLMNPVVVSGFNVCICWYQVFFCLTLFRVLAILESISFFFLTRSRRSQIVLFILTKIKHLSVRRWSNKQWSVGP